MTPITGTAGPQCNRPPAFAEAPCVRPSPSTSVAFVPSKAGLVTDARTLPWDGLVAWLGKVTVGEKDGPGWLPADIQPGPRTADRIKHVSLLVLDIEAKTVADPVTHAKEVVGTAPPAPSAVATELGLWGWGGVIHTSHSHLAPDILPAGVNHNRYRLALRVSRPLVPGEVRPLGLHVLSLLGLTDCADKGCLEPARLFYLPRCPAERRDLFEHHVIEGDPLNVDELLANAKRETSAAGEKQTAHPPRTGSVIAAFNSAHDIGALLEGHGYVPKGRGRWMHPESTTGTAGVRLLPNTEPPRVFSSHGCCLLNDGHAHDAFSAFVILAHGGDARAAVRAAAEALGMGPAPSGKPQGESGQHQREDGDPGPWGDPGDSPSGSSSSDHGGRFSESHEGGDWPEPKPLPGGLAPVEPFRFELLPTVLRPWVQDICERVQCAPDFVAAASITALAAALGRKVAIRPQAETDWAVVGNLWAIIIGRPGVLKSPAMEAALAPLKRLAAQACEAHEGAARDHERDKAVGKLRQAAAEKQAAKLLEKDPRADVGHLLEADEPDVPVLRRYIANEPTAAALGELLRQNPDGLLLHRDEIVFLLRALDRDDNAEVRGFYLTGWNGDSGYTFDRILRGMNLHIPAVCLSLLGSTQPGRIAHYIRQAVTGGAEDDGLIQRFGLLVWPDTDGGWKDVDRWPNSEARRQAFAAFDAMVQLDPAAVGAMQDTGFNDEPDGLPYLRFADDGLGLFREWRQDLEASLRSGDLHPAMESHLSKYRKLVPGLALLLHLADGLTGPVGRRQVLQALGWSEYLTTHARRAYGAVAAPESDAAKAILYRLRRGDLAAPFRGWEVYLPGWTGRTDREVTQDALHLLVELDYLATTKVETRGRTATVYVVNPRAPT